MIHSMKHCLVLKRSELSSQENTWRSYILHISKKVKETNIVATCRCDSVTFRKINGGDSGPKTWWLPGVRRKEDEETEPRGFRAKETII